MRSYVPPLGGTEFAFIKSMHDKQQPNARDPIMSQPQFRKQQSVLTLPAEMNKPAYKKTKSMATVPALNLGGLKPDE